MSILRNVKFLDQMKKSNSVPREAAELFEKFDTYLQYTQNLGLMTDA